ncbi:PREDICTED: probable E3 ubiquitin-protein ligase XERICO [Tarenaya hassleriana]|uniref:probable E3 ubiquitin-protein ligase XERICO n=1 Tax=Tarenaya hassleriana TaxID=28532 RepID=UPI00053C8CB1|nr:PREDICTED: probable E3 ubiquitin-protein ligase XERICO [Tarenaya hassleriana]
MGLSSLPAPSQGMLCIILVNTALSISIFKGIVQYILHVVGVLLTSSPSMPSVTPSEDPSESFGLQFCHAHGLLEEFRNRTPTLRFSSCKKHPDHEQDCSVCLTKFEPESEINNLNCGHLFHKICLEKWIDYWNITCPLCRTSLVPEEDVSSYIW